jgi:hypothetical protein
MLSVAMAAGLAGAVLARRFRLFALVPTIAFLLAVVAVGGVLAGETVRWIVAAMVAAAASLQFGYLVGAFLWSSEKTLRRIKSDSVAPQTGDSNGLNPAHDPISSTGEITLTKDQTLQNGPKENACSVTALTKADAR